MGVVEAKSIEETSDEALAAAAAEQDEDDGVPVEGAAATQTAEHLFAYSTYVDIGEGAEECPHSRDGACHLAAHFHAFICMPNSLQQSDIQDKMRAAKARRKRSLRDETSDAYVILEDEIDDLLRSVGDERDALIGGIARRLVRRRSQEIIREVREGSERYENYAQDVEEWNRLRQEVPEEERNESWKNYDEFKQLDEMITTFGREVAEKVDAEEENEKAILEATDDDTLRTQIKDERVEGESSEYAVGVYYQWLGFIATRQPDRDGKPHKRSYQTLDDFRNAPREVVNAVDGALRDLEDRLIRGDAQGNS